MSETKAEQDKQPRVRGENNMEINGTPEKVECSGTKLEEPNEQTLACNEPQMEHEETIVTDEENRDTTENANQAPQAGQVNKWKELDELNKRKKEKTETAVIKSPFPDNQEMLDEEGYSDVTIGFPRSNKVFRAHRSVLSKNSTTMKELFRGHRVDAHCIYDAEANRVEWEVFGDETIDQSVLFQCIKFCYGAPIHVSPLNAAATIDAVFRLKLVEGQEIQNQVEQHMVSVAEKDVESGSLMLCCCAEHEATNSQGFSQVCPKLATCLFTSRNIEKYKKIIVDNCLMKLAPVYLDCVDYGNPHKEFSLRKEYVVKHKGVLSDSELRDVICKCQFESLTNSELIEMRNLNCVMESVMLDAYEKALSECETRLAQEQKRAEEASKERQTIQEKCLLFFPPENLLILTFNLLKFG